MKKHLFSLVIMLALVVLAGTSAMAQLGTGMIPSDAQYFVVGSTGSFTVTKAAAGNYLDWSLLEVSNDDADVGEAGTVLTPGVAAGIDFVQALGSSTQQADEFDGVGGATDTETAFVKFYSTPSSAAGRELFAIEVKEYEGGDNNLADAECISIRRVYIAVFDFDVDVFFCADAAGDTTGIYSGSAMDGNIAVRNSWHNQVLQNTLSAAELNVNELDSTDNPTHGYLKGDTIYYAVQMKLIGAPIGLDQVEWRFNTEFPNNTFDINRIESIDAGEGQATFYGETTTTGVWGDDAAGDVTSTTSVTVGTDYDWGSQESVLVGNATTADTDNALYVFRAVMHKDFVYDSDDVFDVRIRNVALSLNGGFDDGSKEHANTGTDETDLRDGQTGTFTIYNSPATSTITIAR